MFSNNTSLEVKEILKGWFYELGFTALVYSLIKEAIFIAPFLSDNNEIT